MTATPTGWSDDRVATLKKLWLEGLSGSQIATQLGGVSRNGVIGKAHRLGLTTTHSHQSKSTRSMAHQNKRVRATPWRTPPSPTAPPPEPVKLRPASWAPNVLSRPWTERTSRQCRWPVDGGTDVQWSCCRPIADERYCVDHVGRAYEPAATSAKELARSLRRYA